MPESVFKINLSPERQAKIKAERERLEPLRASLGDLLKSYSFVDVYGEMSHLLFEACAEAFAGIDNPGGFRECVNYMKAVARKTVWSKDEYWLSKLDAYIEEGSAVGGLSFMLQALMDLVVDAHSDSETKVSKLRAVVASEHWYKNQMKTLDAQGRRGA